jgi:hypothetical protein
MTGVPIEKQAEVSVLLDDKVRELVRRHLKEALEDPNFMVSLYDRHPLQSAVFGNPYDPVVVNTIKTVITNQMQKY